MEWDIKSEPARPLFPAAATHIQASTGELAITLVYARWISTTIRAPTHPCVRSPR